MAEFKTNAMRILDAHKVPYQIHTYAPGPDVDGVCVAHQLGQNVEQVYKTLVTKGKQAYFVFVIPVAHVLDLKKAARAVGEKSVSMIAVKEINGVTGYIRGGCSPIGMKRTCVTVIDSRAQSWPTIIVSGGRIGCQIEIAPQLLCQQIGARYADLLME